MKKILILILGVILLMSCCKKPQGTPVDPTVWLDAFGKYKTENVIIVDTALNKTELCDSVSTWLQKAEIEILNADTCVFNCSGKYLVAKGTVKYNLTLTILDNRFKYVHTGFTYDDKPLEAVGKQKKVVGFLNTEILKDMNSLKDFLKK